MREISSNGTEYDFSLDYVLIGQTNTLNVY